MPSRTDDLRIKSLRPLISPAILMEEVAVSEAGLDTVAHARERVAEVLTGTSDKLLVVVGPCSIHDPEAGLEYAERLHELADELADELVIVMRAYFEKPRTTVGWKGLINDPFFDNSFAINQGLRKARGFLRDVVELGLPTGTEFLDPISPQFIADLVSWGAIGARTVESQVHRELASGLSMPVGFKNGTGGTVQIAIDAIAAAAHPHHFLSVTKQGITAIVETMGNRHCHIVLRGGGGRPNYAAEDVARVIVTLREQGLPPSIMIDCSHGNSGKDPTAQPKVAADVARRVAAGDRHIFGVMLESFLVAGRQDMRRSEGMTFGQSITDACLGWEETVPVLEELAQAARARRGGRSTPSAR